MALSDTAVFTPPHRARQDHDSFFESYAWCLNPILSVRQQLQRLREELRRAATATAAWQIGECEANTYLFVCSLACTVDDYLAWQFYDVSDLCTRLGALALLVRPAGFLVNCIMALFRRPGVRSVLRWRQSWGEIVDRVCVLLAGNGGRAEWADLSRDIEPLLTARLPCPLLARRLRIPEAFRCQDMAHPDVYTLVNRFVELGHDRSAPVVVIGPRTAGAYLAPLASAYLAFAGWADTRWLTVRPRNGISRREMDSLGRLVRRPGIRVILIDDYPNTGGTHRKLLQLLYGVGVLPTRITVLAPRHPHRLEWDLPEEKRQGVTVLTLEPSELHKAKLLDAAEWVESVLSEHFQQHGWTRVRLQQNPETWALNARLSSELSDGFHVRLKRVFDVRLEGPTSTSSIRVLAKSAGWGWFGYHAYIAGTRLHGFVPDVIGAREGLFFSRWIEAEKRSPSPDRVGAYVARRANALAVDEDPVLDSIGYRWVGWNEMLEMMRGLYGPYWNRLKVPAIRRHLARHLNRVRAMVDGQMKPEDWLGAGNGALKADFEQHNFGGPEFDLVDPAYDLAGAVFELGMGPDAETSMVRSYVDDTGDSDIHNRLTLFKAFYGAIVLKRTTDALSWGGTPQVISCREALNRKALEFLTTQMNQYCAGTAGRGGQPWPWSDRLFFLDLDGIFYGNLLGFPHPTPAGVASLELLRTNGIAVVPNTARDCAHAREFCRMYGVPGALAEQGSIFVDAVRDRELPLINTRAAHQLSHCREALSSLDGVHVDDAFRFSVRACRIQDGKRTGLGLDRTNRLLQDMGLDALTAIESQAHTDIMQKSTDKGTGVRRVLSLLGVAPERAAAIGHALEDIPMLNACGTRYAPAQCSAAVREAAGFRMGLQSAARHFAKHRGRLRLSRTLPCDPFASLLRVSDRSFFVQLACLALFTSL